MCCAQCQALRKAPRSAVCIRTLTVSKGCPAVTFAAPAAAPPNPSSIAWNSNVWERRNPEPMVSRMTHTWEEEGKARGTSQHHSSAG
eukprot:scaffold1909_cov303-Pavlova_lutheri.AAC.5